VEDVQVEPDNKSKEEDKWDENPSESPTFGWKEGEGVQQTKQSMQSLEALLDKKQSGRKPKFKNSTDLLEHPSGMDQLPVQIQVVESQVCRSKQQPKVKMRA
jgi:hypothetical protein